MPCRGLGEKTGKKGGVMGKCREFDDRVGIEWHKTIVLEKGSKRLEKQTQAKSVPFQTFP